MKETFIGVGKHSWDFVSIFSRWLLESARKGYSFDASMRDVLKVPIMGDREHST